MKTRRFCPHCGRPLVKSQLSKSINRYTFQCRVCEEDFFKFEVLKKTDMALIKYLRRIALYRDQLHHKTLSNGESTHNQFLIVDSNNTITREEY